MNTILVPVDFSIYSEHAIDVAFQIAKAKGVSVHLLHCVEKGESHQDTDTKLSDYTTQATALGIQVQSFIEEGSRAHKVITTHAHSHQADLIIMGSHGLTPGDSQFIGSNAQRVVRHAPCPVFTIKNRQDQFKIERIVYPSDFKYETDPMFNRVLDFANFFNAKIELVYVNTPSNFSDSQKIRISSAYLWKTKPFASKLLSTGISVDSAIKCMP